MVQKYKENLKETMFLRKNMSNMRKLVVILFLAISCGMSNSVLAQNDFEDVDPTYIGAPLGMTMPEMDNQTAKVIFLQ